MKIPKSVKIGAVTYKIIVTPRWRSKDNEDFGETFFDTNTIYICSDISQAAKEVTLIHEALHCMNTTMNHEFLDSLSTQIHQFLSDNRFLKTR